MNNETRRARAQRIDPHRPAPTEVTEQEARDLATRDGWVYRERYAVIDGDGLVLMLELRRGVRRRRVTELCVTADAVDAARARVLRRRDTDL